MVVVSTGGQITNKEGIEHRRMARAEALDLLELMKVETPSDSDVRRV